MALGEFRNSVTLFGAVRFRVLWAQVHMGWTAGLEHSTDRGSLQHRSPVASCSPGAADCNP